MKRVHVAVAILAIVGTSLTSAQESRVGGFGRVSGFFRNERVQRELKMTKEEVDSLRENLKKANGNLGALYNLGPEERRKGLDEIFKKQDEIIKAALDEKQQKRLRELQLQRDGADALLESDVAENLALDQVQKDKLRKIQKEYPQPERARRLRQSAQERREFLALVGERRKIRTAASFVVLTDEQKEAFTKMQGKKFDFGHPRRSQEPSEER